MRFPGYEVETLVGRGGTGSVYRALDDRHGRIVAIKVLDAEVSELVPAERFLREIRITAGLAHPHILPLLDSGQSDGRLFYVMPFIEGSTLQDRIDAGNLLTPAEACRLGAELADALAYAHSHGVVHRDIKPANVLLADGQPLLADFGLARVLDSVADQRLTGARWVLGTPRYMSPEQAQGSREADARSDIFSLGCTLFEAVVGALPHEMPVAPPPQSRLTHLFRRGTAASDSLPRGLRRVLLRAMEPSAAVRFQNAAELALALRRCAEARLPRAALLFGIPAVLVVSAVTVALTARTQSVRLVPDRVAVATLANRTGQPELDALGSMAADWITQGLQQTGLVDVVPTASVRGVELFSAAGGSGPSDIVDVLGRYTGAGLVLSGSYFRVGDSLRFLVQVTDSRRGEVVAGAEPVSAPISAPEHAVREVRSRTMSLLARHLDQRLSSAPGASTRPPIFEAYERFTLGMDAYAQTDWSGALLEFSAARTLDPGFVQAALFEALVLTNLGRYEESAVLLDSVNLRRADLSAYDRHWLDYRRAFIDGDQARAIQAIRRAAQIAPSSKASYNLAVEAMEHGLLTESLSALEKLEANSGAMVGFRPYLATVTTVNHLLGRHREELRRAREMMRLYPGDPWASRLEIDALAALGREGAVLRRAAEQAGGLSATEAPAVLTVVREAADELRAHGHGQAARAVLDWGLRWWEDQPPAVREIAAARREWVQLLRRAGRLAEAEAALRGLRRETPGDIELMTTEAVIDAAMRRQTRVAVLLDSLEAADGKYRFGANHYGLARVEAVRGDTARMLAHLRQARDAGWALGVRIHREPDFEPYRSDPAFRRLAAPWTVD